MFKRLNDLDLAESFLLAEREEDLEKEENNREQVSNLFIEALKHLPKDKFYIAVIDKPKDSEDEVIISATGVFKKCLIAPKDGAFEPWSNNGPLNGVIELSWKKGSEKIEMKMRCTSGAKSLTKNPGFLRWVGEEDPEEIRSSIRGIAKWEGKPSVESNFFDEDRDSADLVELINNLQSLAVFYLYAKKDFTHKKAIPMKKKWPKTVKNVHGVEGWGDTISADADEDEGHHKWN